MAALKVMIDEESVFVTTNEATCDNEETVNDAVFSDLVNSTTEIVDGNECVNAYEALCESLVNPEMKMYDLFEAEVEALEVKFDYAYLSCEDWLQVLTEKKLIDEFCLER
jgi:hypothetical protein